MMPSQRQKQIMDLIAVKKAVTVEQLCGKMYASPATIRRDLTALEGRGLIQRTHGGAVLLEGAGDEQSILARQEKNAEAKKKIGELAACFIKDSSTVMMDPSSTVCSVVPFLTRHRRLSVVTNGLNCALALSRQTSAGVYLPSGKLNVRSNALVGSGTIRDIAGYYADVCLLSCAGLSPEFGVTEPSVEQAGIKTAMMGQAKTRILLADGSKFGQRFLAKVCGLEQFDYVITDRRPDPELETYFSTIGCDLVYPEQT